MEEHDEIAQVSHHEKINDKHEKNDRKLGMDSEFHKKLQTKSIEDLHQEINIKELHDTKEFQNNEDFIDDKEVPEISNKNHITENEDYKESSKQVFEDENLIKIKKEDKGNHKSKSPSNDLNLSQDFKPQAEKHLNEIPFTTEGINQISPESKSPNFFDNQGQFESIFKSELPSDQIPESSINLQSELTFLREENQTLRLELSLKSDTIKKLKKIINDHKTDPVSVLQTRINSLIDEKVKITYELEKISKTNKEYSAKIENYKKIIESSDNVQKKRDSQLESVISKTNSLKSEIVSLKLDLQKKNSIISGLNIELLELRPLKELKNIQEKHLRSLEEMKKIIESKENEIQVLKSLIKNLQSANFPIDQLKSPSKLPPIKTGRSNLSQKNILTAKIGFSNKSNTQDYSKTQPIKLLKPGFKGLKAADWKGEDFEISVLEATELDEGKIKAELVRKEEEVRIEEEKLKEMLEKLEIENREREREEMEIEEGISIEIRREENERIQKENERIRKEVELQREIIERDLMDIEDQTMKDFLALLENERVQKELEIQEKKQTQKSKPLPRSKPKPDKKPAQGKPARKK